MKIGEGDGRMEVKSVNDALMCWCNQRIRQAASWEAMRAWNSLRTGKHDSISNYKPRAVFTFNCFLFQLLLGIHCSTLNFHLQVPQFNSESFATEFLPIRKCNYISLCNLHSFPVYPNLPASFSFHMSGAFALITELIRVVFSKCLIFQFIAFHVERNSSFPQGL